MTCRFDHNRIPRFCHCPECDAVMLPTITPETKKWWQECAAGKPSRKEIRRLFEEMWEKLGGNMGEPR